MDFLGHVLYGVLSGDWKEQNPSVPQLVEWRTVEVNADIPCVSGLKKKMAETARDLLVC